MSASQNSNKAESDNERQATKVAQSPSDSK
jgi:hypothetical protein